MAEERMFAQLLAGIQELQKSGAELKADIKKNDEKLMAELRKNDEKLMTLKEDMMTELKKNDEKLMAETKEQFDKLNERFNKSIELVSEEFSGKVVRVEEKLQLFEERVMSVEERLKQINDGHVSSVSLTSLNTPPCQSLIKLKPGYFNGKTSWEEYQTQFEIIAELNGWSDTEKASVLAGILRESAMSVLQSLSKEDRRQYDKLTAALKLRYGDVHRSELLYGQLHGRIQKHKEDLSAFAYDIQNLARRAFANSPADTQEYIAARQFVEGLIDPEIQKVVRLASPRNLQEALVKALEIEAALKATKNCSRNICSVEEDRDNQVQAVKYTNQQSQQARSFGRFGTASRTASCWRCGRNGHMRYQCRARLNETKVDGATNTAQTQTVPENSN